MDRTCKGCLRKVALHPESHSHDVSIAGLLPCPPPRQYFSDIPGREAAPMSTCLQLHLVRPVLTPSDSSMQHSSSHPTSQQDSERSSSTDPCLCLETDQPAQRDFNKMTPLVTHVPPRNLGCVPGFSSSPFPPTACQQAPSPTFRLPFEGPGWYFFPLPSFLYASCTNTSTRPPQPVTPT